MTPLHHIAGNSRFDLDEILAAPPAEAIASDRDSAAVCTLFRRIAMSFLVGFADHRTCQVVLSKSAWCRVWWLGQAAPETARASTAAPVFDALVAEDDAALRDLLAHTPDRIVAGREYEEDFAWGRGVLTLAAGGDEAAVDRLLAWWTETVGDADPRHRLLTALRSRDAQAATAALQEVLDANAEHMMAARRESRLFPDDVHTLAGFDLEGAAIVKLARRRGLALDLLHRRLPAELLEPRRDPLPPGTEWRTTPDLPRL